MRTRVLAALVTAALTITGSAALGAATNDNGGGRSAANSQYKGGIQDGGGNNPGKKGAWPPNSTGNSKTGNGDKTGNGGKTGPGGPGNGNGERVCMQCGVNAPIGQMCPGGCGRLMLSNDHGR